MQRAALEQEKNVLHQIAKASEAIRRKYKILKLNNLECDAKNEANNPFKPIMDPLKKLINSSSSSPSSSSSLSLFTPTSAAAAGTPLRIQQQQKQQQQQQQQSIRTTSNLKRTSSAKNNTNNNKEKNIRKKLFISDDNGNDDDSNYADIDDDYDDDDDHRKFEETKEKINKEKGEEEEENEEKINKHFIKIKQVPRCLGLIKDSNKLIKPRFKTKQKSSLDKERTVDISNIIKSLEKKKRKKKNNTEIEEEEEEDGKTKIKIGAALPKYKTIKTLHNTNRECIDYIYWDDPNELIQRLKLLIASQSAGNNNHSNEIISIIEELREAHLIL